MKKFPLCGVFIALLSVALVRTASAQNIGTALVNGAPQINSGRVEGNVQQMTGANVTLNGGAVITGDLLVPGTPTLIKNGQYTFGGVIVGTGSTSPSNYQVILNGTVTLGHLRTRTNPVAIPALPAVPAPTGTRTVTITAAGQSAGSFATLRNLTLNGNVGQYVVPPGTYGDFIANGGSGFTLGVAGSSQPAVYDLQHLTLNGATKILTVGPVIINVANGFTANGTAGTSANPAWLKLNIVTGGFTLNGGCTLYGYATVQNGMLIINGAAKLIGGASCNGLTVNANGLLQLFDSTSFENKPPTVAITSPAAGTVFNVGTAIPLTASATDTDGSVAKVEFFAGATKLGEATASPWTYTWPNATAGSYQLTAVATDNLGAKTTSAAVPITVNAPPTVALTAPANQSVFQSGGVISLTANAADSDGTIQKVEFFADGAKLGEKTTAPYSFTWITASVGPHVLTARATDNNGAQTVSATVNIRVNAAPSATMTSPANGSVAQLGSVIPLAANASDSDGTIAKVEFYAGATKVGEDTTAPYQFNWSNAAAGHYSLTARAIDNDGAQGTSAPINLTINAPPAVAITAPAAAQVFNPGATISITANPSDADGTVTKVEFFAGSNKIGEASAAPWTISWPAPTPGLYQLSAVATDDLGAHATSSLVSIRINAPPTVSIAAPSDQAVVQPGSSIAITANASDSDGTIAKVEFFADATKLGESSAVPYSFNWTGAAPGSYSLTAKATDNSGASSTSALVHLRVNALPSVTLTAPAQNAAFAIGDSVTITASANDTDDGIAKVEFFAGNTKIGESVNSPYTLVWTGETEGQNVLTARATDGSGGSATSAPVTINVHQPNHAPVVDAGPAQTIELPAAAVLNGTATDDGLPTGSALIVSWIKVSGPGVVTFQAPASPITRVSFSSVGTYVLRLTGSDGELSTSVEVTITVNPENHPPVVNAGADQTIELPEPLALHGTVTDDGNPIGKALTITWSQVSGPGPVTFANKNAAETSATLTLAGTYILKLTGNDTEFNRSDNVVITVLPHNNAPIVSGGGNKSVEVPDTLQLNGTATDDGLPAGGQLVIGWSKVSGPGDVTFGNPAQASTTAKFSLAGNYLLRLTANDSQLTSTDDVVVSVDPASNRAPVVNAGPDQTLSLYNVANLNGQITDDGLPNGTVTASWTKVAGPGDVVFSNAGASSTSATFSETGVYVLRLTADDSALTAFDEITVAANFENQAPVVDAGPDRTGNVLSPLAFNGQVTDDGLPTNAPLTVTWSKVSGPGVVTFSNADSTATSATFSDTGEYVLQLSANDSELSASDQVTVQISSVCTSPPPSLAGFWSGDDNALDAVGGNNGALINGAGFAPGEVRDAFSLSGGSFIKVPAASGLDVGTSDGFTIELWIKPGADTSSLQPLIEYNNGLNFGPHLWLAAGGPGTLFANIVDTNGVYHIFSSALGLVTPNTFQHVAVTYDKTTGLGVLYKDGQIVAQASLGQFIPQTSVDLYFGYRPGYSFTGKLDEVSLYQRALRPDEIQTIYQAGSGGKCSDAINHPPVVQAGPAQSIPLSYSLPLQGSVSDDGRPAGAAISSTWTRVSGPGVATFVDGSLPTTNVTFSAPGTYVLRLTATDSELTGHGDVTITVIADDQTVPSTLTITPYQAPDWRYKIYPLDGVPPNAGAIDFDDSDYALGRGAFGSGGGCFVQTTVHTNWPTFTEIVLRRTIDLPANVTNVRVSGTVDNDVQIVINGFAATSGFIGHEGCAQLDDTRINVVTTSLLPGPNLFVVHGRDRGGESFVDVQLLVDQPVTADAGPDATVAGGSLVTLDGSHSAAFSGSVLTFQWAQIGGPIVPLDLTDPVHPHFTAPANSTNAILTFRLIVNDGRITSSPDTVAITALASNVNNLAPVVNAGPDETLPSSTATLQGSIQDDGIPSPSVLTVRWSAVSGPGAVSFANPNAAATTAQFTRPGTYTLRLSASDSQLIGSDDIVITVPGGVNLPPSVNAGPDQTVTLPQNINLSAQASDDGLPNGTLTSRWALLSGPGQVTFGNAFTTSTTASFTVPGTYVLRFIASDSALSSTDDVTVTVIQGGNQPPTADAGPDQTISIHSAAVLDGNGDDDGLPAGVLNFQWSVLSAPGSVNFTNTNGVISATFGSPGSYVLQFRVSDSQLSATDDLVVTVYGDNQPPVVSAGGNQSVRSGNGASLHGTVTDDGLPLGSSVTATWSKVSGPGVVTFANANAPATLATFDQPGAYLLQLSASDGALSGSSTTTVSVTSAANVPPSVSISSPANGSNALASHSVTIVASASDSDGTVTQVAFYVNGSLIGQSSPPFTFAWSGGPAGTYSLTAAATDNEGASATSAAVSLQVVDGSNTPPVVEIQSPLEGDTLTAPTAIVGTVDTPILQSYVLQYRLKDEACAQWVTFATGYDTVTNASLGTLDTTLLLNGIYEIRLVVTDLNGLSYALQNSVFVDGNMKVGQFTATFKDLELPLSGVPITVTRTYDSRNHCPGDFGYGWTLDVDSIRLESTEQMGDAWSQFIFVGNLFDPSYYRLDDVGPHLVSVKMPDGQLLRFTPKLVMDRPYNRLASLLDQDGDDIGQVYAPIQDDQPIKMIYRARAGTEGAVLKARGYRTTDTIGSWGNVSGQAQFFLADTTEGAISLATRPGEFGEAPAMAGVTGWELTLRDGRVLLFDAEGKLEELRDRVGNKVAFNRDGAGKIERITHTPSGKEIVFARDSANRIKSITDPAGNSVQYRYTTNGDLDAVFERGNNPANNMPTTSFTYKGVTHLLEDILDARGIQAAKNYYDDAGRLIKTVDADGKETIFTHDVNTRTETIKDRAGNITVHRYDERGNVIETRAPDGSVTATDYHRWSDGTLSELKETEFVTGLFPSESDPGGPLVTKTLTTHYSYEDDDPATPPANDGLLRTLIDPKGNITTFTYDEHGNVLSVSDANANAAGGTPAASVVNTYYDNGLLETATDALGHITYYTYDAKGNPDQETRTVTLTNVDGSPSQVSVVTDRDYNVLGQLEKMTDAAGHLTTYEYDTNGNRRFERTTRTNGGSTVPVVTETEYDVQDRAVGTWNADNPRAQAARPSSQMVYDENGKIEWTYDALGRGTHQEYDSRGLLFKTTHPDNTFETVSYDADGRREVSTDRRGMATKTVYDAMGRAIQAIFLGGNGDTPVTLSTTRYDAAGRVWQSVDANNNTTSYGYDDAGRRTSVVSPAVAVSGGGTTTPTTRYSYDANGNLRFVTDAKNRVTEHVYDTLNRRVRTILPAAQLDINGDGLFGGNEQSVVSTIVTGYDEMGRRVSETDASNRTKRYGYDVLGRLRHVIDYAGQATRFDYDELGNQLSQTDTNNHATSYTCDNAGRRLTRTLPLGQQELLGYDEAGNLTSRRDFNGRVTTFGYDAMNRLRYRVPDASLSEPTVEFTYNANGQRETMRDMSGTTYYGYDGRGQLLSKQTTFGTLSYAYHPNGSLKQLSSSNANGINVSYSYDALNRLANVADANIGNTTYGYDEVGNLKQVVYPNNIKHQYTYNALNRLDLLIDLSPTNSIINSWRYRATPAGQRTWVEEFDQRTAWYTYDTLGRLKTETVTGSIQDGKNGTVTYGHDNVGNRLSRTSSLSGVTNQSFSYDANDRVNGDTFDNNGNTRTAAASQPSTTNSQQLLGTDSYDSQDRLVQRAGTLNSQPSTFNLIYDGDGNRVCEVLNGLVKSYLLDDRNPTGYAQVVEEIVNGNVNRTYTYGLDLISQDQLNPATNSWRASFYAYDGRGTVRFLSDETGAVTDTYTYDAFGTLITVVGSTNNRYLYSGEQFDPNLGLYYLRARLMNPLTGRFWSMDSHEGNNSEPISLHKYVYGANDPSDRNDPTGHYSLTEIGIAVGIGLITSAGYVNAPGPHDRIYASDPAGVELIINIVGGGAVNGLIIKPLASLVSQVFSYTTKQLGGSIIARFSSAAESAAVENGISAEVKQTFSGGIFSRRITEQKIILKRVEGGDSGNFGGFYSTETPFSGLDAEEMFNIMKYGKNTMERIVTYELDAGAEIFEGQVAGGASSQIYIPYGTRVQLRASGQMRIISQEPLPANVGSPGGPPPGSMLH
jgi:RHS repeat-associated protein